MASTFASRAASAGASRSRLFLRRLTDTAINVVAWTSVFVFVLDRVGSVATVNGRSMQPTLNPDSNQLARDVLLLNKYSLSTRAWKRGDVVTLRSPSDPDHVVSKRIIALEHDFVIPDHRSTFVRRAGLAPGQAIRIPKGHVWVEGDAGLHSRDSNEYGPVPLGLITSKIAAVVWPLNRIGWVGAGDQARRGAAGGASSVGSMRTAVVPREQMRS